MQDEQVICAIELDDSYQVLSILASGPSGRTELVTRGGVGPFVRKRIPAAIANQAAWGVAMGLSCPRVPKVISLYALPDELVVVTEYVEGESLEARLSRGPLTVAEAVRVASEVCEAASALHAAGIIHRDITPKNVILSRDGAHLIDLGIARLGAQASPRPQAGRKDTVALGTYGFAAPEQFGFAQTDERSDVYSIGKLLLFMLTGQTEVSTASGEQVPAWLVDVINRATAFEPSARPATAEELSAALRGAGPAVPAPASPVAAGETSTKRAGLVRKIREASEPRKLSSLFVIALFAIMVAESIQTLVGRWPTIDPSSRVEDVSFGLLTTAMLVVWAHQGVSAIVGAGAYEREEHRLRRFIINSFVALMAMALLVVAITRLT